jgi:ribosomal protein S17E
MAYDDSRSKCEMVTIKFGKDGKTKEIPCKGVKFTDAYLPHDDPFDHNKALVAEYTDVDNKRMRNWIAGYVTTYIQRRTD